MQLVKNVSNGTNVGITANVFDLVDYEASIIYFLANDAGSRFQIDSSSGVVSIKDSNLLNYRNSNTHEIIVEAINDNGVSIYQQFNIDVLDHFSVGDPDGLYYVYDDTVFKSYISITHGYFY